MSAYYNENDRVAAHVLRSLIRDGVIADGHVDERSIKDVQPEDLSGFTQCHFFAGGGLWSVAARLAEWPDKRPLWTGSCPCQPFSVAGKGAGTSDPRHLWPHFHRLIRSCRPPVVMGEQVAKQAGRDWFDGVRSDLKGDGYAARAVDIPACAVNAPHIRSRLYWVAEDLGDTDRHGRTKGQSAAEAVRHGNTAESASRVADANGSRPQIGSIGENISRDLRDERKTDEPYDVGNWHSHEWRIGADGKARRVKPGIRLLAHGVPGRVDLLRIGGNAIVAPLAAEVIKAYLEAEQSETRSAYRGARRALKR